MMEKEQIHMDEYAQAAPPSFHPLGKHDLNTAEERHGVFDHSDGRLVVDPEEAKLEVRYPLFGDSLITEWARGADKMTGGSMEKRSRVG